MSGLTVVLIYIVAAIALAYRRASLKTAAIANGILLLVYLLFGSGSGIWTFLLLISAACLGVLSAAVFRQTRISRPLFEWYRRIVPALSETEREALDAGTVWWEGELFSGKPDWNKLLSSGRPRLSDREQAFIDGPLEELCRMVDSWRINYEWADMPAEVVAFIKKNKFLGLIIPRQYGGLELSAVAQTEVLTKLFGVSSVVANFISVPNSLGPAELLLKYGTEQQKQYYLPRLANGGEIPCFALTAPLAGSDAAAIPDTGVVCKDKWQGKMITGMRLDFDKRYITLAPVATLIGLAFKLKDPGHLLGDVEEYGITCALIPADTPGVEIGHRHLPMGDPFLNGPVRGRDIFVPLDNIIGGIDMAGKGWRMLVNCLSAGRSISLPSISNCMAKRALAGSSAYARIRRQFNLPIARFEGIQKPIARIAGLAYIINAARLHTAQAIDMGSKPAVPSAILKYHCTEMGRQIGMDAMDIHGGKAIMKGPRNYLSYAYEAMPVAITVEGANILTRNLMIFGQGATRCHPYVLREMAMAQKEVTAASVAEFDRLLFAHIGFAYSNAAHAFVHALSGSLFSGVLIDSPLKRYYQHINRLSAAFALVSDAAMITMQSALKRREMISARLGDLLSMLYLSSLVLKHHEDEGCPQEEQPLVEWACQYLLNRYQGAMHEILQNFPNRLVAMKLRLTVFPLGRWFNKPADSLETQIADLVTRNSETRKRLISGIYITPSQTNPLGMLNEVFMQADEVEPLQKKIRDAVKAGKLEDLPGTKLIDVAEHAEVLNGDEAAQLRDYDKRVMEIIHVDEFPYHSFARQSLQKKTTVRRQKTKRKAKRKTAKKPTTKTD
ncbi:MAG: acyl-CoA dehydrogenase [Gammaproteobacteria bacterium]